MTNSFTSPPNGNAKRMCGIGLSLVPDPNTRELLITRIQPGTHAARSNVAVGDVLVEVDGKIVTGLPQVEVRDLIMGVEGTPVTLGIKRRPHDHFSIRVLRSSSGPSPNTSGSDTVLFPRSNPPSENNSGRLCGIGMNIARNNGGALYVVSMVPTGPAGLSGVLQPGDVILKINDVDVQRGSMEFVRDLILGPAGSMVSLCVRRGHRIINARFQRQMPQDETRQDARIRARNPSFDGRRSASRTRSVEPPIADVRGRSLEPAMTDARGRSIEPPERRGKSVDPNTRRFIINNINNSNQDTVMKPARMRSQEPPAANRQREPSVSRDPPTDAQLWRAATGADWNAVQRWVTDFDHLQAAKHPTLGCTLAHVAAVQGRVPELQWLSKLPSWDPFSVDKHGNNLAHVGAVQGHINVLDWLAKRGECDPHAKNRLGDTISDVARRQNRFEVLDWLARARPTVDDLIRSQTDTRIAERRSRGPENRWGNNNSGDHRSRSPKLVDNRSLSPPELRPRTPSQQTIIRTIPNNNNITNINDGTPPRGLYSNNNNNVRDPRGDYYVPQAIQPPVPQQQQQQQAMVAPIAQIPYEGSPVRQPPQPQPRHYPPSPDRDDEATYVSIPDIDGSVDYLGVENRARDRLKELVCKGIISKRISEEMVDFEMRWERVRLYEWQKSVSGCLPSGLSAL